MSRLSSSWTLLKASWAVLRADKELIIFPIIAFVGSIVVTLTFMVPMILTRMFDGLSEGNGQFGVIVVTFLFYVVQYTIIIFANSALVGAAMIRLKGGDPTVRDGLNIASQHFGAILGYAVISATVGMVLRWLSERGMLGRIVSSLFGMAWNVITYLAVPILVIEGVGPVDAIKRSGTLLKKTWGEQIVGNLGLGAVFGLIFLALILLFVPVIVAVASTQSTALIIAVIVGYVLLFIGLGLFSSALNGIYTAAVYQYATSGDTGEFFDASLVQNAFRTK
ncbi:MAG: DUF6159 family protein [Anaerolineae bacterium]